MSAAEDEADVDRVLAGDVPAFEQIVRRWQVPLINLANRFFRDRGRAEDMAQEAFLKVYRSLPTWRREAAFSTWLFALATNLYRSELKRHPVVHIPFETLPEPADDRVTDEAQGEQQRRVLHRAIDNLPQKYREALILFYFHDMNVAVAAASLGLPEGTFKARLSRGREMLKRKLQGTSQFVAWNIQ